jgi:hypothetical protein
MKNWIGKQNPWSLQAPPAWWLQRLHERDAALRVLPGLKEPCYRVARVSAAMKTVTPILGNDSETGRMCREGVVPVVSLRPDCTWNDDFFTWLDAHDTWRVGGPKKFADLLEAQEAQADERLDKQIDDEAGERATAAYFAKLVRDGAVAFLSNASSSVELSAQGAAFDTETS